MGFTKREKKVFVTILSDATLRIPTTETDPDAVKRTFKTSAGVEMTKYELVEDEYTGFIKEIRFNETDFGTMLNVVFEKEEGINDEISISMSASGNFGTDLMKKLSNVDFSKEITFAPFSFTSNDTGKEIRGISLKQIGHPENKVPNYFYDVANKVGINGMPVPAGDTKVYTKDDWKIYFMQVKKFLMDHVVENVIPILNEVVSKRVLAPVVEPATEEPTPDSVGEEPAGSGPLGSAMGLEVEGGYIPEDLRDGSVPLEEAPDGGVVTKTIPF